MSDSKPISEERAEKLIQFLQLVGKLKKVRRTGWVLRQVEDPECIAGHMYRMAIMTFLLDGSQDVDRTRCLQLAVVHDLAECIVGDITPRCGIDVDEKHRREDEAMRQLADLAGPCGYDLYQLYKEYEEQETAEAKVVKELDRFDMILQAFEYEKCEARPHDLQEFFQSTVGKFSHPLLSSLATQLDKQRQQFENSSAALK
ncbi:hypothetical protein L9F63_021915 [Diploptera punctata]|uniref:5'-deoxynucleotidase HDDC2 n=1 Tax=Diploptera punctata TaxID=6984 RepID=A0AAD8EBK0_DIPPU|nr:hypothetical protein L9F63_021915 [Diploptera punctata]